MLQVVYVCVCVYVLCAARGKGMRHAQQAAKIRLAVLISLRLRVYV